MEKIYQYIMQIPMIKKFCSLPVICKFTTYEALTYIFFGALTTLVNWVSYMVLKEWLNQTTGFSNAVAWVIAFLFAYFVNKKFVFKSHQVNFAGLAREFILFLIARLLSFAFDEAFMIVTVDYLYFPDALAKILSNLFVIIMNFFASKIFIFKSKPISKTPGEEIRKNCHRLIASKRQIEQGKQVKKTSVELEKFEDE